MLSIMIILDTQISYAYNIFKILNFLIKKGGIYMTYKTHGVCANRIEFEIDNDIITDVHFNGGCAGNTAGIAKLVIGMKVDDVIKRLEGIKCGIKPTSCPDQLAKALKEYKGA